MNKITGTIITLNNEKIIEDCIISLKSLCDEIIVVDSGSTDGTIEVAKKYKVKSIKLFLMLSASISFSETLEITFRYINGPNDSFERVFVPGTMPSGTAND